MNKEAEEAFNVLYVRYPKIADDIMEAIVTASDTERVTITSVDRRDALNKYVCGYADTPKGTFAFEVEDGINRGTVILQWRRPEDFVQKKREQFRGFMLIPSDDRILHGGSPKAKHALRQYRKQIEQPWFKKLVRGYNQDMYNDPAGNRNRKHWQKVLRKHDLRAVAYEDSLRWTGKK
jgi:hypothetical protein